MTVARRWELIYMLASGLFVAYTLRVNMSVTASKMAEEFGWSEDDKGQVLSSFYWGYAFGQLPSSVIGQIYGAKWVFAFCVFLPSIVTLFVPLAAHNSLGTAIFIRVLIGLCASGVFPSLYNFFRNWIPNDERTVMIPFANTGTYMGAILGFLISGLLVDAEVAVFGGWQSCFYLFGLVGIVWFPFFAWRVYEHPEQHPSITQEEIAHINRGKHFVTIAELDARNATHVISNNHRVEFTAVNTSTKLSDIVAIPADQTNDIETGGCNRNDTDSNIKHLTANDLAVDVAADQAREASGVDVQFAVVTADAKRQHDEQQPNVVTRQRQGSMESSVSFLSDDAHAVEIAVRTPWLGFFHSMAFVTLLINSFMANFISFMLLSELPSFLKLVLHFTPAQAGILSMPPYVALFVSVIFFGQLFGYLQKHHHWHVHTVRLVAETIALAGSSICLIITVFCGDVPTAYAFIVIAQFLYGAVSCGVSCGYTDISPNFSFSMNTLGNTIGAVAGFIGPLIVAALTSSYPGIWGWRASFLLTAAMSAVTLVFWMLFSVSHVIHELNTPSAKHNKAGGNGKKGDEKDQRLVVSALSTVSESNKESNKESNQESNKDDRTVEDVVSDKGCPATME